MSIEKNKKKAESWKWKIIKHFGSINAYIVPRGIPKNRFSEILNGKRMPSDDMVIRVEADLKKAKA